MNAEDILTVVLREMTATGKAWRLDWSDFDGRTLRAQLNALANWAEDRLRNPNHEGEFAEGTEFLAEASRRVC